MARGAVAKAEVLKKIQNSFEGAFLYNDGKELRIPMMEDGEQVQIKVALTCAKDNVEPGQDNAIPGAATNNKIEFENTSVEKKVVKPTEEEVKNVNDLLQALGL